MKNVLRTTAVTLLCVMLLTMLAACGGSLSGTYETDPVLGIKSIYTFKGNKVTWSLNGAAETSGTYKIDDNKLVITVNGKDTKHSFKKDGKTLTIDGIQYKKK